uniref:Uncharacterized LOC114480832 n=1 Tax=Gouania willdenowi TaxID=441366 RepID=A0A8C5HMC7_GOUWI
MMMLLANFLLLCSFCAGDVSQPEAFQTLTLEASATIKCYVVGNAACPKRVWYKLTSERKLELVATVNSHENHSIFANGFKYRYSVKFNAKENHLIISTTSWEDAGTYFCGVLHHNNIHFGNGTYLMVKGIRSVVQHPVSQSVQSGHSVTLSCSVDSAQCTAERIDVKWLWSSNRSDSEKIYLPGNRKASVCQSTDSRDMICVYTFHIKNFSSINAGSYICVVTSCGKTLLGNGSKLIADVTADKSPSFLIIIISSVSLPLCVCVITMGICHCTGNWFYTVTSY